MKDTLHSIRGWAAYIMPEPIESSEEITWYAKWAGSVSFRMQTSDLHSGRTGQEGGDSVNRSIFQTAQYPASRQTRLLTFKCISKKNEIYSRARETVAIVEWRRWVTGQDGNKSHLMLWSSHTGTYCNYAYWHREGTKPSLESWQWLSASINPSLLWNMKLHCYVPRSVLLYGVRFWKTFEAELGEASWGRLAYHRRAVLYSWGYAAPSTINSLYLAQQIFRLFLSYSVQFGSSAVGLNSYWLIANVF
jgi:hypothetical protein